MGSVKTINGLARASVKSANGIASASLKKLDGTDVTSGYFFTETFEGSQVDSLTESGYDNTGWTSSTAGNTPGDTASPGPLAGSKSWRSASGGYLYRSITATGTLYCYWVAHYTAITANELLFELRDGSNVTVAALRARATNTLRIEQNGVNSSNAANSTLALNTTYHFWLHWAKGSGSNGTMSLYMSTTAPKPGSPVTNLNITTGAATTDATQLRLGSGTVTFLLDNVVYDPTTVIGSNPV
jgi:hypothetical protein